MWSALMVFSGEERRLQAIRREVDELATSPGRRIAALVTGTRLEVKQLHRNDNGSSSSLGRRRTVSLNGQRRDGRREEEGDGETDG